MIPVSTSIAPLSTAPNLGATTNSSIPALANAMRRASVAHGLHGAHIGEADPNRPDWYAAYMVAEEAGTPLPE